MNGDEVRKLTDEEISIEIRNLRSKLHTLRTQVVTEKVEDVSEFRQHRRDVARLLTERNARLLTSGKRKSKRRASPGAAVAASMPETSGEKAGGGKPVTKAGAKAGGKAGVRGGGRASTRTGTKAAKADKKK